MSRRGITAEHASGWLPSLPIRRAPLAIHFPVIPLSPGQFRILYRAFHETCIAAALPGEYTLSFWNALKDVAGNIWMMHIFQRYTGRSLIPTWETVCQETQVLQEIEQSFLPLQDGEFLAAFVNTMFVDAWDFVRRQYQSQSTLNVNALQLRMITQCCDIFNRQLATEMGLSPVVIESAWALVGPHIESIWSESVFRTILPADWEDVWDVCSVDRHIQSRFGAHDDVHGTLRTFVMHLMQVAWETPDPPPTVTPNNGNQLLAAMTRNRGITHPHNHGGPGLISAMMNAALSENNYHGLNELPMGFHSFEMHPGPTQGSMHIGQLDSSEMNNMRATHAQRFDNLEEALAASLAQMQPLAFAQPLSEATYASFPRLPFAAAVESDASRRGSLCAICQSAFEDEEILVDLPHCHHIFHEDCGREAFDRTTTCPLCRYDYGSTAAPMNPPRLYTGRLRWPQE